MPHDHPQIKAIKIILKPVSIIHLHTNNCAKAKILWNVMNLHKTTWGLDILLGSNHYRNLYLYLLDILTTGLPLNPVHRDWNVDFQHVRTILPLSNLHDRDNSKTSTAKHIIQQSGKTTVLCHEHNFHNVYSYKTDILWEYNNFGSKLQATLCITVRNKSPGGHDICAFI